MTDDIQIWFQNNKFYGNPVSFKFYDDLASH